MANIRDALSMRYQCITILSFRLLYNYVFFISEQKKPNQCDTGKSFDIMAKNGTVIRTECECDQLHYDGDKCEKRE